MEPRICPECGARNDTDELRCLNCNLEFAQEPAAGLLSGPASILAGPAPPEPRQPDPVPPPQAPPAEAYVPPSPSSRGAGGFGVPSDSPSAPPRMQPIRYERPAHGDDGVNWRVVALVVLVLTCSTFASWWFFLRPPCPADTISRLISAVEAGDQNAARACFTSSSLALLGIASGYTGMAGGFLRTGARLSIRVVGTTYEGTEGETAVVQCEPSEAEDLPPGIQIRFELVMLQEEGDWKIDLGKTIKRARGQSSTTTRPSSG